MPKKKDSIGTQIDKTFNTLYNKGACLMNQRKYKEAIYYIDRAMGIEPNHNLAKKAKETILEAIRKGQIKM